MDTRNKFKINNNIHEERCIECGREPITGNLYRCVFEEEALVFTDVFVLVRREVSVFVTELSLLRVTFILREGVIAVSMFSRSLLTA